MLIFPWNRSPTNCFQSISSWHPGHQAVLTAHGEQLATPHHCGAICWRFGSRLKAIRATPFSCSHALHLCYAFRRVWHFSFPSHERREPDVTREKSSSPWPLTHHVALASLRSNLQWNGCCSDRLLPPRTNIPHDVILASGGVYRQANGDITAAQRSTWSPGFKLIYFSKIHHLCSWCPSLKCRFGFNSTIFVLAPECPPAGGGCLNATGT